MAGTAYDEPLFFQVIRYAARADRDVIEMVSGNPDWEPPEALREGLRSYAAADRDRFQYSPSPGLRELREEIAARRGVEDGTVVVTAGATEADYLALARALERDAGEEVLLADPVYPYYPGQVDLLGGRARTVPVAEDGCLDPDAVRAAAGPETAAILINTPNNPTGAVYDRATVAELVAVAEEADALLISDEVYDHFDYTGGFESALTVDSDRRVVTGAFSKSMAITGFRVGYAVFPPGVADAAETRHMLVTIAASRPAQAAVLRALRETPPDYYEEVRARLRERIDAFTDGLDAAGAAYTRPEGAFYVLARFDGFPGTMANAERLIDGAGVAGMPGEAFGEARADHFRFALVTPRAAAAADRLAEFF